MYVDMHKSYPPPSCPVPVHEPAPARPTITLDSNPCVSLVGPSARGLFLWLGNDTDRRSVCFEWITLTAKERQLDLDTYAGTRGELRKCLAPAKDGTGEVISIGIKVTHLGVVWPDAPNMSARR